MNQGLLLDTNALIWLENGSFFRPEARVDVAQAARRGRLYTCALSAWEAGLALRKRNLWQRPDLGSRTSLAWFKESSNAIYAKSISLSAEICAEAAEVPLASGWGDPGDCFLIATARILDLTLVTRDRRILELAADNSTYLSALAC